MTTECSACVKPSTTVRDFSVDGLGFVTLCNDCDSKDRSETAHFIKNKQKLIGVVMVTVGEKLVKDERERFAKILDSETWIPVAALIRLKKRIFSDE